MTTTPAARDERDVFTYTVNDSDRSVHMVLAADYDAAIERAALAESELAEVRALSVTNIMLAVVPGADGMGEEVYAKSVDDVLQAFTKVEDRADKFQAECEELATEVADRLRRTLALQKERDELRAELERVAKESRRILEILDHPTRSVTIFDADALRSALGSIDAARGVEG